MYIMHYIQIEWEKQNWWVVIETKLRVMVKNLMLEGAYHFIHLVPKEELVDSLHNIDGWLEEVQPTTLIGDDIVEENEQSKDEDREESENKDKDLNSTISYKDLENSNNDDQINYLDFDWWIVYFDWMHLY